MISRLKLFKWTGFLVAISLICQPIAMADVSPQDCEVFLGGDREQLLERLFDQNYTGAGKHAYALLKNKLKKKVLEKCQAGCTDEELAIVIKDTLQQFSGVANRIDKYSHIAGGWILLAAALVGLSDASFVLSQHVPGQLTVTVTTLVSVTAATMLAPIISSPASVTFRGLYRLLLFGKPFFRDDSVTQKLDIQTAIVREKQTPLESQQVGRNMQAVSYAASRAKEAADLIASVNQVTGPGRAASNLTTIAVLMHKYFPEMSPEEASDVDMAVHELFTKWLPDDWKTDEKRKQLFDMILSEVKMHDYSIRDQNDENYYRVLIKKWLDLA